MFEKILIANRGEIAVRIIRACREMGISTVAIYSQADKESLHTSLADESVCVGGPRAKDSYLNMMAIISAAVGMGAQAIHPGYGLLSESSRFAKLCTECGIKFIGPGSELISLLGDKEAARKTMVAAGVPVIPGAGLLPNSRIAYREAKRIGTPLLIKARSGGGGKGIRRVDDIKDVPSAFADASNEAKAAFNDDGCYMEKLLENVKHIEMQLLCDEHGNAVCLGERDCSVQRKNQKLLEESPSIIVSPQLRKKMVKAAVSAAKTIGYNSVGTIEFLVDKEENFYFMEMNTRLQVEHPVTEFVTGIDLVKWQIRTAYGAKLPFKQEDIEISGHSIECRINAEDPLNNFMPSTGNIEFLHIPGGNGVRFDTALYQGYNVPPYYDSMLGKLIVHAHTRDEAVRRMRTALGELVIDGIKNTIDLQLDILEDNEFLSGRYTTGFMEEKNV